MPLSGRALGGTEPAIYDTCKRGSDERRYPKQPELAECPAANDHGRSGATRRVNRGIGNWDAYEVNQRETQSDGDRRQSLGCALVGGAQDDYEEHEGH